MNFEQVGLDLLLAELSDLPSEWLDDESRHLIAEIPAIVARLRAGEKIPTRWPPLSYGSKSPN